MKRILLTLVAAFLLAGCASRHARVLKSMPTYVGQPIEVVLAAWGPPNTVYEAGAGKHYVWHRTYARTLPGYVHTTDYGSGVKRSTAYSGPTIVRQRFYLFEVDAQGTIIGWQSGRQR